MPVAEAPAAVLAESEWLGRRRAHEARALAWTGPHRRRAALGQPHPVYDFLFSYYAFRPSWLERWHPGPDVVLEGETAREFLRWPAYREAAGGVALDPAALPPGRRAFARWLRTLLNGIERRPAFFGCHGLHEWAMVHRQPEEQRRHAAWPLRLGPEQLARFVEGMPVCCTHFDAFRFFTPAARPLNRVQPTREAAPRLEQGGCLHANMDLYKWASRLSPLAPSELVADCFELALAIREADMRASPYDLSGLGFAPIAIETEAGRAEYEGLQRGFAARAEPLRRGLLRLCARLLGDGGHG